MKKLIRLYFLIALQASFLTGCVFGGFSPNRGGSLIIGASKDDPEKSKRSSATAGICEDDLDCVDICEDIYGDSRDEEESEGRVERCLGLTYKTVDAFEDIIEALEDPAYSKFQNLDAKYFADFLYVSVEPWIEFIKSMGRTESEIVLRWIASEKGVSNGIESAYDNYEDVEDYDGVYKLLMDIAPDRSGDYSDREDIACAEICSSVYESAIGGGKSFMGVVDKAGNNSAEGIVLNLIKDVCNPVTPILRETDTTDSECYQYNVTYP